MKLTASFKRGVAQVKREWRAARYDQALSAVNRLLQDWPDNPRLLTMWGNLVQLQSEESGPALDEAHASLRRAVELDDDSPGAWKELGHFLSAVEDDARGASRCFDKTISLCKSMLAEALLANAQSLSELERREEALGCIAEAYWLQSHNGKSNGAGGAEILDRLNELAKTGPIGFSSHSGAVR
jgi:tetratricopeptide (TPR) repeat protein